MTNGNDPRLRQDKVERKDKENSNAGMIAAVIILIIGIVGIFLYYNYEALPNNPPSSTNNNPSTNNSVPTNAPTQPGPQT